jgi:tRNA-specific 2-thiouridylase
VRAVSLLSGGLDSLLATKVMLEQGLEVHAINFVTAFCTCTPKGSSCSAAVSAVRQLGIGLKTVNNSRPLIEAVKHPRYGYGSNMNPCLDCRILMFGSAREYMEEIGASFIITGEVLGERPMSQRRDAMMLIEKAAGLKGLVVRPLSAALLEPSIPELKGWVDRSKLLALHGRSRAPQIELARSYDLRDYPCPAGGCLLTDPGFAARMRDLMTHEPDFGLNDVQLLKSGRHFRLSPAVKAVVGRNEDENARLNNLSREGDALLELVDFPGPLTVVRGPAGEGELALASAITARYTKGSGQSSVLVRVRGNGRHNELRVRPASEEAVGAVRINI